MNINLNSGYGSAQASGAPFTTGKLFVVAASGDPYFNEIDELYGYDSAGVQRRYSNYSNAIDACVDGRGDVIIVSPNFTTAITSSEIDSAESKGVAIHVAGRNVNGLYFADRASETLPQSTSTNLFDVTSKVEIVSIVGKVTTDIQNQANNTKLVASPSASGASDVDLTAVLDIANDGAGTIYTITGTTSDALQSNANGVVQYPSNSIVVPAGTIDLDCAASNTGEVKWKVQYRPIDPGARVDAS